MNSPLDLIVDQLLRTTWAGVATTWLSIAGGLTALLAEPLLGFPAETALGISYAFIALAMLSATIMMARQFLLHWTAPD